MYQHGNIENYTFFKSTLHVFHANGIKTFGLVGDWQKLFQLAFIERGAVVNPPPRKKQNHPNLMQNPSTKPWEN